LVSESSTIDSDFFCCIKLSSSMARDSFSIVGCYYKKKAEAMIIHQTNVKP
jgi:hypothetical protein